MIVIGQVKKWYFSNSVKTPKKFLHLINNIDDEIIIIRNLRKINKYKKIEYVANYLIMLRSDYGFVTLCMHK